jgi:hypothetical protein
MKRSKDLRLLQEGLTKEEKSLQQLPQLKRRSHDGRAQSCGVSPRPSLDIGCNPLQLLSSNQGIDIYL